MISFCQIGYLGRLGNQMFQMASTIGIAKRLGYESKFPSEVFTKNESPDSYEGCKLNECFQIPEAFFAPFDEIKKNTAFIYQESDFTYNRQTESLPDGCNLYGYFQTEKYFRDYRKDILKIFKFREEIEKKANEVLEVKDNFISVHVRRGDYVSASQHHPTQDMEYYTKAMNLFKRDSIFCVFSDDIDWCKNNFKGENFIFVETNNPYVDMCLMSKFKNHIIANSSFSWWGSWLADSQKTVAPLNWFGPMIPKDTSDVYCVGWSVI